MTSTEPRPPATAAPGVPPRAQAPGPRRAYRDTSAPVLGGVAGGLAEHLGVGVLAVRVAFLVTAVLGGLGVMLYAALWIFLPPAREQVLSPGLASHERGGRRQAGGRRLQDVGPLVALAALGVGVLLLLESVLGRAAVFWPLAVAVVGVALLWRQADEAQRARWLDPRSGLDPVRMVFGTGGWAAYARVAAGLALVLAALLWFVLGDGSLAGVGDLALAVGLGFAGIAVVLGPWTYRLATDLGAEREERVRSQERADMAAHLHDSVLQTLALIQRSADDPAAVARLARAQERDLRAWLYADEVAGAETLAGALRALAADTEERFPVTVEVVAVGDAPFSEALRPLVAAAGEAVVNAAKHADVDRVDVYAEVGAREAEVNVRDRGVGFDPDRVAEDRLGLRRSIHERMTRHGGRAVVRTAPGEGTEVRLHLPLPQPAERDDDRGGAR
ncbi:ATP-binding protein [Nocardioides sp. GY 10127]|uniref:ATP-binding protein n=1 Tax=Nocardioides sp. GY 10127 TaxID=2569762 RepID=UPI0010A7F94F|nr:ATP-binding protein [Nocardioides sp. GY 10127]TIC84321.1 PspC domain-containing protein [Nocardioides sp. GY 10127]